MAMVLPKLFAASNRCPRVITKKYLEKYSYLIKWKNRPSVLEIGYADGGTSQESFFPHLPKDMKEYIATDISEEMVEYARKNTTHPLMKVAQLDVATKSLPSEYINRFDHIFGFFVMHLVKNPREAFMNMHKMLKPEGSIFLTFFEHTPVDDVIDGMAKNTDWNKYGLDRLISPYYYSPNPRMEWERNLKATGFQNYEFFEENYTYEFLNDKEFDDLCLSVCCFLKDIPSHKLEDFKELFKKETRKGKLVGTQVRDGKEILSFNFKLFITSATRT